MNNYRRYYLFAPQKQSILESVVLCTVNNKYSQYNPSIHSIPQKTVMILGFHRTLIAPPLEVYIKSKTYSIVHII